VRNWELDKKEEGSSTTDYVTDVTDVTDVSPMSVGRRKTEDGKKQLSVYPSLACLAIGNWELGIGN